MIHVAEQLLVMLRSEQVGGQGSTCPARQSSSFTSTRPLTQPVGQVVSGVTTNSGQLKEQSNQSGWKHVNSLKFGGNVSPLRTGGCV